MLLNENHQRVLALLTPAPVQEEIPGGHTRRELVAVLDLPPVKVGWLLQDLIYVGRIWSGIAAYYPEFRNCGPATLVYFAYPA